MSLFDETIDNGWVPIRRNLLPHLADGRLTATEYITLVYLLLTCGSSTGETQTCASVVADLHGWKERHTQKAMKGLLRKGYIEAEQVQGRRGIYKVRVINFERTTGPEKGLRTTPKLAVTRSKAGGETCTEEAVKTSVTEAVREASQVTENRSGYTTTLTAIDGDDGGETAVTRSKAGGETAAIQERQFNTDKDKENEEGVSEALASSDSSAPGQESPEWRLTRLLFQHLGEPAKFKGKGFGPAWTKKFRALLRDESFETIRDVMEWGFEIDSFWPKHLMRTDRDPLEFFLSKFADLKSRAAGELKARRNQAKQVKDSPAQKTTKEFPKLLVCNDDPVAEMMERMAREGASL